MSRKAEIEQTLLTFIVEELLEEGLYEGGDPLTSETLDSLGLEQLIDYIEAEFGVRIVDPELASENLASLPKLAAFVEAERNGGSP